jgi:hypothetical protein
MIFSFMGSLWIVWKKWSKLRETTLSCPSQNLRVLVYNTYFYSYGDLEAFVFRKVVFGKSLSKLSCVCLPLKKLVNRKYFPVSGKHFTVKEKFGLVSRKVFSFYFGRKTLSGSCEKFRNVILFVDYIKFGPQTFDCLYILCFEYLFFNFIS